MTTEKHPHIPMTQNALDSIQRQVAEANASSVLADYLKRVGYEGTLKIDADDETLQEIVADGLDWPQVILTQPDKDGRDKTVCAFVVSTDTEARQSLAGTTNLRSLRFQPEVEVLCHSASRWEPDDWDTKLLGQPERTLERAVQTFIVESFKNDLQVCLQGEGEAKFHAESAQVEQAWMEEESTPTPSVRPRL